MTWIILALLAAFFYAIESVSDKIAVSRQLKNPTEANIIGSGSLFLVLVIFGLVAGGGFAAPHVMAIAFCSGIISHAVGWLYFVALRTEEVSRVMPVYALMPAITAVLAYFLLGERFGPSGYVGIIFIVCGSLLISLRMKRGNFHISSALVLVFISAVLAGGRNVVTKMLDGQAGDWTLILWMGLGGLCAVLLTHFFHDHTPIRPREWRGVRLLVISGAVGAVAASLSTLSILYGHASLSSALVEVNPVFVLAFASLFAAHHPELSDEVMTSRVIVQKMIAITVILVGAALVSFAA